MKKIFQIILLTFWVFKLSAQTETSYEYAVILNKAYPILDGFSDKSKKIKTSMPIDTFQIFKVIENQFLKIGDNQFLEYDKAGMTIEKYTISIYKPQSPDEAFEMSQSYRDILGKKGVLPDWKATRSKVTRIDTIEIIQIEEK